MLLVNHNATLFDESDTNQAEGYTFLYFELRNVGRKAFPLAHSTSSTAPPAAGQEVWRIRRVFSAEDGNKNGILDPGEDGTGGEDYCQENGILDYDRENIDPTKNENAIGILDDKTTIPVDGVYTIGTGDNFGGVSRTSDFYIDTTPNDANQEYELVIPNINVPTGPIMLNATPDPTTNLDLCHSRDEGSGTNPPKPKFVLDNGSTGRLFQF